MRGTDDGSGSLFSYVNLGGAGADGASAASDPADREWGAGGAERGFFGAVCAAGSPLDPTREAAAGLVPSTEKWSEDRSRLTLGCARTEAQKLGSDLSLQQPVPVLREYRVIPNRIINPQPNEPAKQQVELKPLHQLALRADRVESLQQRAGGSLGEYEKPEAPGWRR